jgi:hypothetical protein
VPHSRDEYVPVRPWWQDLLIQSGGGLIGTVGALVVGAFAAKAAGLLPHDLDVKGRVWAALFGTLELIAPALLAVVVLTIFILIVGVMVRLVMALT